MKRVLSFVASIAFGFAVVAITPAPATAGGTKTQYGGNITEHPQSGYYRGRSQVRGFRRGVGGYSYSYPDGEIDFRDTSLLDPQLSIGSSQSGPFDSGYFFDSGVDSTLSSAPYLY